MFSFVTSLPPIAIAAGGMLMFLLTVVQMLIGYRKIRFKGRTHLRVHKTVAWVIIVGALFHGTAAMIYLGIIK